MVKTLLSYDITSLKGNSKTNTKKGSNMKRDENQGQMWGQKRKGERRRPLLTPLS